MPNAPNQIKSASTTNVELDVESTTTVIAMKSVSPPTAKMDVESTPTAAPDKSAKV